MTKKNVIELLEILQNFYPDAKCSLNFSTPFEMVIAVMLSAQCTDERVNKTTPNLFSKYKTPVDFAKIDTSIIEELIRPCGFSKTKANNIKNLSILLVDNFNGIVPQTIEELMTLPGIGRKSANVIMLEAFNNPQGIAVDTHCIRISNRLGLSNNTNPLKIEQDLVKVIPTKYFRSVNHLFIWHGRNICKAQKPICSSCPVQRFCKFCQTKKQKI